MFDISSPHADNTGALKATPIKVRRPLFVFPESIDPVIFVDRPEQSFIYIGTTLLLPFLEPYLIRSMRGAKSAVRYPRLSADIDAFIGQESQHYKQHQRMNAIIKLESFTGLDKLMTEINSDYENFTKTRSLRFNLAYAEGFEASTMAASRFVLASGILNHCHPVIREFSQWHMAEELEHRTVTFDVFEHVFGGYWYRLFAGLYAQWHLLQFIFRVVFCLVKGTDRAFWRKYGGFRKSLLRCSGFFVECLIHLWPKILSTYMPWYSPHKVSLMRFSELMAFAWLNDRNRNTQSSLDSM